MRNKSSNILNHLNDQDCIIIFMAKVFDELGISKSTRGSVSLTEISDDILSNETDYLIRKNGAVRSPARFPRFVLCRMRRWRDASYPTYSPECLSCKNSMNRHFDVSCCQIHSPDRRNPSIEHFGAYALRYSSAFSLPLRSNYHVQRSVSVNTRL